MSLNIKALTDTQKNESRRTEFLQRFSGYADFLRLNKETGEITAIFTRTLDGRLRNVAIEYRYSDWPEYFPRQSDFLDDRKSPLALR